MYDLPGHTAYSLQPNENLHKSNNNFNKNKSVTLDTNNSVEEKTQERSLSSASMEFPFSTERERDLMNFFKSSNSIEAQSVSKPSSVSNVVSSGMSAEPNLPSSVQITKKASTERGKTRFDELR
jgi:hypothetical protein